MRPSSLIITPLPEAPPARMQTVHGTTLSTTVLTCFSIALRSSRFSGWAFKKAGGNGGAFDFSGRAGAVVGVEESSARVLPRGGRKDPAKTTATKKNRHSFINQVPSKCI